VLWDAMSAPETVATLPLLRVAAAALIATSVFVEALAFCSRRQHRNGVRARGHRQMGTWQSWIWPLVAPTLLMGLFTAFGAEAALHLGIVPRTLGGLWGVLFGCFVHLSWSHYLWNAVAFLVLGYLVLQTLADASPRFGTKVAEASSNRSPAFPFALASAFIAIVSGLCVWCLAREAVHAGSSGVVCGYAGLLLALLVRRSQVPLGPLLMVLGVAACYGGAALLSRPGRSCTSGVCLRLTLYEACTSSTTSAEHHTFGFLAGLTSALFFCWPGRKAIEVHAREQKAT